MTRLWKRVRAHARRLAGFTLVELMVAVTGGLFVSMAVFMLAKQASGLYQSETRMSNATLGSMVGFERLRLDLMRAGYLAAPNLRGNLQKLCGPPDPSWPKMIQNMQALLIQKTGSLPQLLQDNGIHPDEITLTGSYGGNEQFDASSITLQGGNVVVTLDMTQPLLNLHYQDPPNAGDTTAQTKLLASVFGLGRALRIVTDDGLEQYGTIDAVAGGPTPTITLGSNPAIQFASTSGGLHCGVSGNGGASHHLVNVVNFVKYSLRNLSDAVTYPQYAPLYQPPNIPNPPPIDTMRTELVREELDVNGVTISGTEEVVAEYAVDLEFGLVVSNVVTANGFSSPIEQLGAISPGNAAVLKWAGLPTELGVNQGPQAVRAVRARLSVRSVEADRMGGLGDGGALYRFGTGPGATPPFARVRTMQADVATRNLRGITWR